MPTWLLVAGLVIFAVTVLSALGFARAAARGDDQLAMPNVESDAPQPAKRFERSHQQQAQG